VLITVLLVGITFEFLCAHNASANSHRIGLSAARLDPNSSTDRLDERRDHAGTAHECESRSPPATELTAGKKLQNRDCARRAKKSSPLHRRSQSTWATLTELARPSDAGPARPDFLPSPIRAKCCSS
jgi:hypothetical protein